MKTRITSFLLTVVIILLSFSMFSCAKNREYDAAEVEKEAESLIKASILLNYIYYGEGIPATTDSTNASGYYYPADTSFAASYGIQTINDLKKKTKEVFSSSMYNVIMETKLGESASESGEFLGFARYYQKYNTLTDEPECIMVYKNADVILKDTLEYDYDSIRAVESKLETVFVEIDVVVTTSAGKKQEKTLTIGLIEESGGWRLATTTFTTYFDSDYYDELKDDGVK